MEPDDVNRPVWSRDVELFANDFSWTDTGERKAIHLVADQLRGRPILDVGIGTGRSAWLWRLVTDKYVGIDYTPEMVTAALRLFPGLDAREGDARDLAEFIDGSFDLVTFSNNGIDALDHPGRQLALAEFRRVLSPDGLVLFSTLDKSGYAYHATPWQTRERGRVIKRSVLFLVRLPANIGRIGRSYANWWRRRRAGEDHGGWAIGLFMAHEFGLMVHYITPDEQRRELVEHGFEVLHLIDDEGVELVEGSRPTRHMFFHVIAKRAADAADRAS